MPFIGLMIFIWGLQSQAVNKDKDSVLYQYATTSLSLESIQPIPQMINLDTDVIELGNKLFVDSRLSDKGMSCVSCHNINEAGDDGVKVSLDIRGGFDQMNTPTIFNVSLNPLLTWYGVNLTLEDQLDNVLANEKHMNGNWDNIIGRLSKDRFYRERFNILYSDGLTHNNVRSALVTFERSLLTPNSPFDDYLRGDDLAISISQKKGYVLFKQYGCIACHQGINIGGNLHARLGTFISPFEKNRNNFSESDFNFGRYNLTGSENDKYVFRVPSLRNVARTAPYFHSGEVGSLEDAVKLMGQYQIGREIDDKDVSLIVAFLHSLTGEYKGRAL